MPIKFEVNRSNTGRVIRGKIALNGDFNVTYLNVYHAHNLLWTCLIFRVGQDIYHIIYVCFKFQTI